MVAPALKSLYVCQTCGFKNSKWLGRCPECKEWNSLVEECERPLTTVSSALPAVPYLELASQETNRVNTRSAEFDRVLGGGVVPGSLVLLGGEPGIGKSTLLLQIAESLSQQSFKVLYVAGEESAEQIRLRGERLGIEGKHLFLIAETCLEQVFKEVSRLAPDLLIVDSIQTVFTGKLDSIPGSIGQVRECAAQLLTFAKQESVPVFLIGHITKEGALAGPKALEHIVDTVLYFEGERNQNHKIVRAVKNRFGPANELGIFQMTNRGLVCVDNPSQLLLAERAKQASGSVVLCAIKGSRPVLVEIQALVSQSNYSTARRMTNGIDPNRVSLLIAVLEKRAGLHLIGSDVYVNVAGKLSLDEPAVDLAILGAIISSFQDIPVPSQTAILGEVGLSGEVRAVNFAHNRVKEAANLGFKRLILPRSNLPLAESVGGIELVGVSSISDYLEL